jgi:hypothetical protein
MNERGADADGVRSCSEIVRDTSPCGGDILTVVGCADGAPPQEALFLDMRDGVRWSLITLQGAVPTVTRFES